MISLRGSPATRLPPAAPGPGGAGAGAAQLRGAAAAEAAAGGRGGRVPWFSFACATGVYVHVCIHAQVCIHIRVYVHIICAGTCVI